MTDNYQLNTIRIKLNTTDGRIVINLGDDWWYRLDGDNLVADIDVHGDDWKEYTATDIEEPYIVKLPKEDDWVDVYGIQVPIWYAGCHTLPNYETIEDLDVFEAETLKVLAAIRAVRAIKNSKVLEMAKKAQERDN